MRTVLLTALLVLATACGGTDATTTTAVVDGPAPSIIPDDPELRRNIYQTGINAHGLVEVGEERWVELAEAGCEAGAWEWGVARALGEQFLDHYDPEGAAPRDGIAQTVWLMTILGCRDLFPQGAIDRGPPPPVGP